MSYEKFAYYYDSLMEPSFYDDYLNFILEHVRFNRVFEIGCGTGEMAIRLARLDKLVYATDLSDDMLEVARMKAMEADVTLFLKKVDMTDFEISEEVDLVLCLCDSLNYVIQKDDVLKVFKNVFHSLKRNAYFIFDVHSLYMINHVYDGYFEKEDEEDFYFEWSVKKIGYGKVEHHVIIKDKIENEEVDEYHIEQTYSTSEYIELLKIAGFNRIQCYSDFKDYDEEGHRVIFVVRKDS